MNKVKALKALQAEMAAAKLPLSANLIFGEGNINAKVMFIGEAPGRDEDAQIRPFVGRGGQLLRQCIREAGYKEEEVYITNIVKRRPPKNRDPLPREIRAYGPYLSRQIETIAPMVIVTLGRFAMSHFLSAAKITKDQGKIFRVDGRCVVPMLHPAAALRAPAMMRLFRKTFSRLPQIIEKCESLSAES
jgi:DNA polymerase